MMLFQTQGCGNSIQTVAAEDQHYRYGRWKPQTQVSSKSWSCHKTDVNEDRLDAFCDL